MASAKNSVNFDTVSCYFVMLQKPWLKMVKDGRLRDGLKVNARLIGPIKQNQVKLNTY